MSSSDVRRGSATALFAVAFFFWFSQYAYASYINPVLLERGMSAAFMGRVGALYGLAQLVFRIPVGLAADRLNRQKLVVVLGCLLSMISAMGIAMLQSPIALMAFRTVGGLAACSWVSCTVLYSRYFPAGESAGRITQLNTGSYFGRLGSYLCVAMLIPAFGMRVSFWVGAAGAAAALLLCLFAQDRRADSRPAGVRDFLQVMRDRNLLACSLLGALIMFAEFATEYTFSTNVHVALGASANQISYFSMALLVPSIIANHAVGRMILRGASAKRIMILGLALMALYSFLTPRATALWQFYPIQMLAGVSNSLTVAVLLGQCVRTVGARHRSTAMGFYQAVYSLGLTLGPLAMGLLIDRAGYRISFDLIAACCMLTIALTAAMLPQDRARGRVAAR